MLIEQVCIGERLYNNAPRVRYFLGIMNEGKWMPAEGASHMCQHQRYSLTMSMAALRAARDSLL